MAPMRFDRATISLVPRSTANCLDLAVLFCGHHLKPVLQLWLLFAIPCCGLVYVLSRRIESGLPVAGLVLLLATGPMGVLLISGAAPATFGEPFKLSRLLKRFAADGKMTLLHVLLMRLGIGVGLVFCLIPAALLTAYWGFRTEKSMLSSLHEHLQDRRTEELVKTEFADLFIRGMLIGLFCALLWLVMFVTADMACNLLFGFPILLGRLQEMIDPEDLGYYMEAWGTDIAYLLWSDPRVLAALTATGLLVYPIGRLAWYFCYIDLRVRRDCWDIELQFLQTARRLESAT